MKIKLGIIGNGKHFRKRIKPILKKLKIFSASNILNRKNEKDFFKKKFDLIYIASQTGFHKKYIKKCLKNNFNVMCEKPLDINFKDILNYTKIAKKNNLLLFDCLMYKFHDSFKYLKKVLNCKDIKYIYSSFKFPSIDSKDFRYKSKHGGFFWDAAIYPLSLDILLFESIGKFKNISSSAVFKKTFLRGNIVQKNKKILKIYKWGEGQNYENNLEIICKNESFFINKFFSKLNNEKINVLRSKNKVRHTFSNNHFEKMFKVVINNFNNRNFKDQSIKEISKIYKHVHKILSVTKKIYI